jgi:phage nucleotide-binding protein
MPHDLREILGVKRPGETEWINVFIYGEPKTGKTRLVATAADHPDTAPLLLIDVDAGTTTIRDRKDDPNIDVVEVRSVADFQKKLNDLQKAGDDLSDTYKTVAVDNMTEVQQLDLKVIMKAAYSKNPQSVDIDVPSPREWLKSGEHMRAIARAIRDLPCNTILTAHTYEKENEGKPNKLYPGFGGQAKTAVAGFMDVVGYMQIVQDRGKEAYTTVQFQGTRGVLAGDRFDVLDNIMNNATFPEIWQKIKGTEIITPEMLLTKTGE